MNHVTLKPLLCVLFLLSVASLTPVHARLNDNNLIEFSRGSYPNMSIKASFWPPFVKIYQDGKVIHFDSDPTPRYFVSQLDPQQLNALKKRLAEENYLSKSRFIDLEGDFINFHGGVSYIRYLDGDKEVLLATEVKPKGGPWVQLTEEIFEYVPDDHEHVYYPPSIGVQTFEDKLEPWEQKPGVWPFSSQLRLNKKLTNISDPQIIHYLFDRLHGIFSFWVWHFEDGKKLYSVFLLNVPGWYEQDHLNEAVAKLRNSGPRVTER